MAVRDDLLSVDCCGRGAISTTLVSGSAPSALSYGLCSVSLLDKQYISAHASPSLVEGIIPFVPEEGNRRIVANTNL